MHAVFFIQADLEVEFVATVFHRQGDGICTDLKKPDTGKLFFDTIEGKIAAACDEPLGFSPGPQLVAFVHHGFTYNPNKPHR